MKKTTSNFKIFIIAVVLVLSGLTSISQSPPAADYSFNGNSLVSGTDRTVGALYRFTAVKAGVDALVTITSMVNASLAAIDVSGPGWNAAFQPNITVLKLTTGYVEFKIDFVVAGTSTPAPQPVIAVTGLDIDGYNFAANQKLYEFEQFDLGPNAYGEFNFGGGHLTVGFVGTAIKGTNVGGVDFGSISLDERVRFTAFKSTVSSVTVRSGAINGDQFNDVTRQRSFYFARFAYSSSFLLDASYLKSFNGGLVQNDFVRLNWALAKNHSIAKIDIEHSTKADGSFETLNTIVNPQEGSSEFTDYKAGAGIHYYRIKLYETSGKYYYSQIIIIRSNATEETGIRIFPAICNTKTTISLNAQQKSTGRLEVKNYNGRVVLSRQIMIREGMNSIEVPLNASLPAGFYIVSVTTTTHKHAGKIMKVAQ